MESRSLASYLRQQKRTEEHQTEGETASFITFFLRQKSAQLMVMPNMRTILDDFDNC